MAQIAGLADLRGAGPPGDIGTFQAFASVIVYKFTFSGTTYCVAQRMGVRGWVLVSPPNTNFVTLINAVIAAASAGDTIYIKAGTYVVGTTVIGKSGVSLYGAGSGTIFDCRTIAYLSRVLEVWGTIAAAVNLTVNAAQWDNHIHAASATFAAGDLVNIVSAAVWRANPDAQLQGELQILGSAAGDILTFRSTAGYGGVLCDSYATADTAQVIKLTPVRAMVIEGIKFLGVRGNTGNVGECLTGIDLRAGVYCTVSHCDFENITRTAIEIWDSFGCTFDGNHFLNSDMAGLGYGLAFMFGCQGCTASNNIGEMCRHMITIGGGAAAGIPRNLNVVDNHAFDCYSEALNSHNIGEHINFIDNTVFGGRYGINPAMYSGIVQGNSITASGVGISLDAIQGDGVLITNNHCNYCLEDGIRSLTANARRDIIKDNLILRSGNFGIEIRNRNYCVISGNTILDSAWSGMYVHTCTYLTIENNFIMGSGTAADTTYYGIWLHTACDYNQIRYNTIRTGANANKPAGSIEIQDATCDVNRITDNILEQGTWQPITNAGTGTIILRNTGYITENRVAATITALVTSIAFAHGCSYTPAAGDIHPTLTNLPTTPIGDLYIDTIGAANATLHCTTPPGVATAIFDIEIRKTL